MCAVHHHIFPGKDQPQSRMQEKRSHTRRQTYLFENTTVKAEINALGLGKKVVSKKLETI